MPKNRAKNNRNIFEIQELVVFSLVNEKIQPFKKNKTLYFCIKHRISILNTT